ncbi:MAG: hypothetical protein NZM09_12120 [Ignavibacterium sp.]|nr:hypothetical protein [Ignavibacterium sp.]MDW8376421.1 hypothetical protein [Ignavibacteriales bacterium]
MPEIKVDLLLFKLSGGDISKTALIEKLDAEFCFDWYYMLRVKEINEMKVRAAEWQRLK